MKILFITSSRIGDAVLTTGILNHVTQTIPNVDIALAAGPVAMPLFEDWPHIIWRHTFERRGPGKHWLDLWKRARSVSWDWVIDLRGSAFAWTVRAHKRSVWKKPSQPMHRVKAIAEVINLKSPPAPHLYLSEARINRIQESLPQKPFFVLAPAANWLGKEWPLERFQALSEQLLKGPFKNWQVGLLAAPQEYERIGPLIETLGAALVPMNPQQSLLDSAAFLKHAGFFIGNDSGLMHMAAALNVPTVGLFGPSPEYLYDPYGPQGCVVRTPVPYQQILKQKQQNPGGCFMESLEVATVYQAVCTHGHNRGVIPCVA